MKEKEEKFNINIEEMMKVGIGPQRFIPRLSLIYRG